MLLTENFEKISATS